MRELCKWQYALLAVPTDSHASARSIAEASGLRVQDVAATLSSTKGMGGTLPFERVIDRSHGRRCWHYRRTVSDDAVRNAVSVHALTHPEQEGAR